MKHSFSSSDVRILNDEILFNGFFKVRGFTLQHRLYNGGWSEVMNRERFERGHAAGVLLYDAVLDKLALVEQFRVGALDDKQSPWLLELVAGIIEAGENPGDVAVREASEEAGCHVKELLPITEYYSSLGGCDEKISLFLGRVDLSNTREGIFGLDNEHEDIRLRLFSWKQVQDLLANNHIRNGLTLIALQWLTLNKDSITARWA